MAILIDDQPIVEPVKVQPSWDQAIPRSVLDELRDRYVKGDRLTVLCEEYGLNYGTICDRSSKENWAELREQYRENGRKAAVIPDRELANRATIERALGPQTDYLKQIDEYREAGAALQVEYDRVKEMLTDDGMEIQDRVALTRTMIMLHERLQVALSIPSVKPVELRQSGSERRVAAVPVG